jgi:hypothetical protein
MHPDAFSRVLDFSSSRFLSRTAYEQVFEMSFTDFTFSFGPLLAAADDAELALELGLEYESPPLSLAVISTLWFAYLLRSTSPEDTTVHVFGADAVLDAAPDALISVNVNDFPSALGVRQPVTV